MRVLWNAANVIIYASEYLKLRPFDFHDIIFRLVHNGFEQCS